MNDFSVSEILASEARNRGIALRHQAMEWATSTATGSFLHPDLVIERAEQFIQYVENGQTGGIFSAGGAAFHIDEQIAYHHPIAQAKRIVFDHVREQLEKAHGHPTFSGDEVYVVWFCKTLQNWKALVSTTLPDGMYYEVTYDGDEEVAYLDVYTKSQNIPIKL